MGILNRGRTHEPIEVAAVAVTTGIDHQRFITASPDGNGLVAKSAKPRVLNRWLLRLEGINLHHPAILISSHAEGITKPLQPLSVKTEWTFGR